MTKTANIALCGEGYTLDAGDEFDTYDVYEGTPGAPFAVICQSGVSDSTADFYESAEAAIAAFRAMSDTWDADLAASGKPFFDDAVNKFNSGSKIVRVNTDEAEAGKTLEWVGIERSNIILARNAA